MKQQITKTCTKCGGAKILKVSVSDPILFEFDPKLSGQFFKMENCDLCHGHGILTRVNSKGIITNAFMSLEDRA